MFKTSPPVGAGADRRTVIRNVVPPLAVDGLGEMLVIVMFRKLSVAVLLTAPRLAVMMAEPVPVAEPVAGNVAEVAPAGTVTDVGTLIFSGSALDKATTTPPAGAAPFKRTVPVWVPP